ncbi:MAG: MarR family transcriptional regulator [Nocardioides sp.]|nr:MarR family transcriptional regulator [Nocardioides sp.]
MVEHASDAGADADTDAGARADALDRVESEVGRVIRRVRLVIAARARMVHPGLHAASYLMLRWVAENGPVRAGAIAEEFSVDKGAVSRMVQSLEELELVERNPDPADGRASLLSATAPAKQMLDRGDGERRDFFSEQMSEWSTADLASFGELLARYNETIEGPG